MNNIDNTPILAMGESIEIKLSVFLFSHWEMLVARDEIKKELPMGAALFTELTRRRF